MIICSCRAISDRDYDNQDQLLQRLHQEDLVCGCCLDDLQDGPVDNNTEKTQ